MIHKYLIQIESAPDTVWLKSGKHVSAMIADSVGDVVAQLTRGSIPRVTAIQEEAASESPAKGT